MVGTVLISRPTSAWPRFPAPEPITSMQHMYAIRSRLLLPGGKPCLLAAGVCLKDSSGNPASITAMITDSCPECEADHIDLQANSFAKESWAASSPSGGTTGRSEFLTAVIVPFTPTHTFQIWQWGLQQLPLFT